MNSEGDIRRKLQQVTFRHLKKRIQDAIKASPSNCIHHMLIPNPFGETVGVCRKLSQDRSLTGKDIVCDPRMGGLEKARACPWFTASRSPEDVKAQFKALMASQDRGGIAAQYPDIAALMWTLDGDTADLGLPTDPPILPPPVHQSIPLQGESESASWVVYGPSSWQWPVP